MSKFVEGVSEKQCDACIHSEVCYVVHLMEHIGPGPPVFIADFTPAKYCEKFLAAYEVREGLELYRKQAQEKKDARKRII